VNGTFEGDLQTREKSSVGRRFGRMARWRTDLLAQIGQRITVYSMNETFRSMTGKEEKKM